MTTGQKAASESSDSTEFLPRMVSVYVSDVERIVGKKYITCKGLEDAADDLRQYSNNLYQSKGDK